MDYNEPFSRYLIHLKKIYLNLKKMDQQEFLSRYKAGERDFQNVNLSSSDLREACLRDVNLTGANLRDAIFMRTDLQFATLEAADLTGANLVFTNFQGATLKDAILEDVSIWKSNLSDEQVATVAQFTPRYIKMGAKRSTGREGTVPFAILGGQESQATQIVEIKWREFTETAGPTLPGQVWEETIMFGTFWLGNQPFTLFLREAEHTWELEVETFYAGHDVLGLFSENRISLREQPLSAQRISDQSWSVKFGLYYGHHFGSVTYRYEIVFNLEQMTAHYQELESVVDID